MKIKRETIGGEPHFLEPHNPSLPLPLLLHGKINNTTQYLPSQYHTMSAAGCIVCEIFYEYSELIVEEKYAQ